MLKLRRVAVSFSFFHFGSHEKEEHVAKSFSSPRVGRNPLHNPIYRNWAWTRLFPGMRVYCGGGACTDKPIRFSGAYKRSPPHCLKSSSPSAPGRRSPCVPKLGSPPESESGFYRSEAFGRTYLTSPNPQLCRAYAVNPRSSLRTLCAPTSSPQWMPEPSLPSFWRSAGVLGRWSWLRPKPLVAQGPNAPWKQQKTEIEKIEMCCRNIKINSWTVTTVTWPAVKRVNEYLYQEEAFRLGDVAQW